MPKAYPRPKGILLEQNEKKDVAIASRSADADIAKTLLDELYIKSMSVDKPSLTLQEIYSSWMPKAEHFARLTC